jgi:hypothetical protein
LGDEEDAGRDFLWSTASELSDTGTKRSYHVLSELEVLCKVESMFDRIVTVKLSRQVSGSSLFMRLSVSAYLDHHVCDGFPCSPRFRGQRRTTTASIRLAWPYIPRDQLGNDVQESVSKVSYVLAFNHILLTLSDLWFPLTTLLG